MLNRVIYEQKFNYHKNEKNNYKMNKYLNKLNIDGGAGPITLSQEQFEDINKLPIIGSGSFGIVRKQGDIIIKKFRKNKEKDYENYMAEKELYIKTISIFGGILIKELDKSIYIYKEDIIDLDLLKNYNIINTEPNKFLIFGNLLDILKIKFNEELKDYKYIYISIESSEYMPIYGMYLISSGTGTRIIKRDIGTCEYNKTGNTETFNLYFNKKNIMKLLKFNDEYKLLYYKDLGVDLYNIYIGRTSEEFKPDIKIRCMLCFDLIRQVNELIEYGIIHNDIKLENIVIKEVNSMPFLTLIDFGLAIKKQDLLDQKEKYIELLINTTIYVYSPEYYRILYYKDHDIDTDYLRLLDNLQHWAIVGICVCILNWTNTQRILFNKLYNSLDDFNIKRNNDRYCNAIIKPFIPTDTHELLREIIKNLLNESIDKEPLSVHYAKFKDLPEYQAYLEQRRLSGIDD
jgi:serine/threonine protein kinase